MAQAQFKVEVYPANSEEVLLFEGVDKLSLVNDDTYGPAPVFEQNIGFEGKVLYVNPRNIAAMEASR